METGAIIAAARCDDADRLIEAAEPLAGLQIRCGGEPGGLIAVPALLDLVRKSRGYGLKLARMIRAVDRDEAINAWVEIIPAADGECAINIRSWQTAPLPLEDAVEQAARRSVIDQAVAELSGRLDSAQRLVTVQASAPDLQSVAEAMQRGLGRAWTDFVTVAGSDHHQPIHWRLLDGANVGVAGSDRAWQARLVPHGPAGFDPSGFDLFFTATVPLDRPVAPLDRPVAPVAPATRTKPENTPGLVGRDVAPVLRQPIARIIANAETIRTRMAGPLAEEYSRYAADIAAAGQHLLALVEDLADLEVVEADEFNTAPDRIDLADVARRAAGILAVRAQERGISIDAPRAGEQLPAIAEFRRVLQVLLNLVGNAIRYAPDNSQIWIRLEDAGARARVIVADQGPGLTEDQQARVFEKFERLGRSDESGSGLGLYISRRLARAMSGDLTVESAPGQGARFVLDVPADLLASAPKTAQQHEDQQPGGDHD